MILKCYVKKNKSAFMVTVAIVVALLASLFLISSGVHAGSYNRDAARDYANAWWDNRNQSYPDYGDFDGCTDCTNYVSQVLHEGGYPLNEGSNDIWHWYYYKRPWYEWKYSENEWEGSKTWKFTNKLNEYASQYQGNHFVFQHPSTLTTGDFFVMDLATNPFEGPDHTRVIVGVENGVPKANQHCVDRHNVDWNHNVPGNTPVWGWHVVW